MTKDMSSNEFSVVIPICDEEENITELYVRLKKVLQEMCKNGKFPKDSYEIILVDDGSSDGSWPLIKALYKKDQRVKGLRFSRNFGHHIAITAGIDHTKGKTVVLMDGDLQDPPEQIPRLYEKFREGYDIVYGIRKKRRDKILKKVNSFLFWWFINKLSGVHMPEGQTMLRILSREVVDVLVNMREYSRFIHGMMAWTGFETAQVEVDHEVRKKGKTKYNLIRQLRLAFYAIMSFSTKPLRLAMMIGLITSLMSFVIGAYLITRKFMLGYPVLGWASIMVSIFFVGGIQVFVVGVIGQYIGKIYQEVQRRPLYVVKELLL